VRPELSRDQDIFFAAVGLLCGFILIFQGWRLDPILQFGQLLLVGTTVFFAVESIRLRSIATQQAKRNTPIVDDEREVSRKYSYSERRKYQAEMDADLEPLPYYEDEEDEEDVPPRPRIRGTRDERSTRDDYYEDQAPRRNERRVSREKPETGDNRRRNEGRSVPRSRESNEAENWRSPSRPVDDWENTETQAKKVTRRSDNQPRRPDNTVISEDSFPPRQKRRRPPVNSSPVRPMEDDEVTPTDYVPYNPLEKPNNSPDHPTNDENDF
jgi:hypothetical protein